MARDPARARAATDEPEVMASIDTDGNAPRLIIADITRNGGWISTSLGGSVSLSEWR